MRCLTWLVCLPMLACICPFDASQCLHPADPERFRREFGHCQEGVLPGSSAPSAPEAPPSPKSTSSDAKGSLRKSDIAEVIHKSDWKVRWCYESALAVFYPPPHAAPEGRIGVRFVIQADGRVGQTTLMGNDVRSPALGCCVLETVRNLRFPKPEGGGIVIVDYPYVFRLHSL